MKTEPSQAAFVLDYFKSRPNEALEYDDWTDEQEARYWALTGYRPRFFRTVARRLAGEGKLKKVRNGVYIFDADMPQGDGRGRRREISVERPPHESENVVDDQTVTSMDSLIAAAKTWLNVLQAKAAELDQETLIAFRDEISQLFNKYDIDK